jgi:sugar (pentulose or hexulose) kinase
MARDLTLSIDIGTGSVRAALVDWTGAILHIAAREHDQIVPQFGWAEQRPRDWWAGVSASIREALGAVEGARVQRARTPKQRGFALSCWTCAIARRSTLSSARSRAWTCW